MENLVQTAKHTQGPWTLTRTLSIIRNLHDSSGHHFAIIRPAADIGGRGFDDALTIDANALLIAAAPELLAALQFVLPVLKHLTVSSLAINASEIADIEALIAKATGQ